MKRAFCAAVFVLVLTLASGGDVVAHRITVTTPAGEVVDNKDLARNITLRLFDEDGNNVGKDEGTFSAASRGTNTACEAVPEDGPVRITGGTCHR
jgi:hypothetical protein